MLTVPYVTVPESSSKSLLVLTISYIIVTDRSYVKEVFACIDNTVCISNR